MLQQCGALNLMHLQPRLYKTTPNTEKRTEPYAWVVVVCLRLAFHMRGGLCK